MQLEMALVGRSGVVKSSVRKNVTRPLVEFYKAERRAFADAAKQYEVDFARYEVAHAEWKKAQRDGPPTDPPVKPEPPTEKRVLVSDTTIEKLGALLEDNPLGLLLVRDELAAWVGSFGQYKTGGKGADQPAWLSMHDAAEVVIDRKTTGSTFIERAAVSVLGGIQPRTLERVFGAAEREAGLLARCLLVYPPDRPALWTDADLPDDVAADWRDLLAALLALPAGTDDLGSPRPRFLPLARDAKALFVAWHDRHVNELADVGDDDLRAYFAKLKGTCVRFALVFACVDVAAGGSPAANIGADAMRRAIAVTEWIKAEGRRLYATLAESDEERDQRRLVELIVRKGGTATPRDLMRASSLYATADRAEAALGELVKTGVGVWAIDSPGPKGGQPSKRFVLADSTPAPRPADSTDSDNTPRHDSASGGSVSVSSVGAPNGADGDDPDGAVTADADEDGV